MIKKMSNGMKTIQRMFELNLTPKEVVWGKRILAVVILPVLVFYTTSMNFIFLGMMNAQAADGSGHMTIDRDTTEVGVSHDYRLTFDPTEAMNGGKVAVSVPTGWTAPICSGEGVNVSLHNVGDPALVLGCSGRDIEVTIGTMASNDGFYLTLSNFTAPITSGTSTFTTKTKLSGGTLRGISGDPTVTVTAGLVDHYTVSTPSGVKVGNNFDVTVTPKDAGNNTTTGGTVTLSAGGSGSLDGETSKSTVSGAATATLSYTKADTITIHATDGSKTGDSSSFAVAGLTVPTFTSPGTPSGSSPNYSTNSNDATPKINWADVTGHNITYTMKLKQKTDTCNLMSYSTDLLLDKNTSGTSEYQVQNDEALLSEAHYCVKVTASDNYGTPNTVDSYLDINLLTSKPATPSAVTIPATTDTPANTINIYNNESFDTTVTHVSTLDGGTAYIKMSDGLGHEVTDSAGISGSVTTTNTTGGDANSLQQGSLNLYARVADAGANESDWSGAQAVTKDTSSPNAPVLVAVTTPTNDDTPSFDWNDASGASHYYFQLDNDSNFSSPVKDIADHTTITSSGYTLSDALTTDGTYYWRVRSLDAAWNKSNWSTSGSFVFDGTHPTAAVTYSKDAGANYSSSIKVKDVDILRIKAVFNEPLADSPVVKVAVDNSVLTATDMTKSSATEYYFNLDVPSGDVNTATVSLSVGTDLAGNLITAAPTSGATFTVDNTKPTVIGTVLPDPTAAGTLNVALTFNESMDQTIAPTVVVKKFDNANLSVSGSFTSATTWTGTATVSSGDANGAASLWVSEAKDIAGNVMDARTDVDTVLIDTTGPTFTIVDGVTTPGPVKTDTIIVAVGDSGAGVVSQVYGFSLDSDCNASDDISISFTSGGSGFNIADNHTDYLCVKATDAVGNTSYQTVGRLNTDNAAPTLNPVHIVSNNTTNTSNATTGNTVTLTFTSSETVGTPMVSIAGHVLGTVSGGGTSWTATYVMAGTDTEGAIPFTIDFSDTAGNTGTTVSGTTDSSGVVFDKSAPSVLTVVSPPTSDNQAISVSYTASDSGLAGVGFAKLYYRIDGGSWTVFDIVSADDYQAYPGSFSFTAPQTGNYDFFVRVKDNAGNESAAPSGDSTPHDLTDARPTTVYVCPSGACTHVANWDAFNTIQAGIDAIREASGNTVNVAAGTYVESINVNKSVTITGAGKDSNASTNTIIQPISGSAGFTITANNVTIKDLRVVVDSFDGISIKAADGVTINNIDIEKTGADYGGPGIFIYGTGIGSVGHTSASSNRLTIIKSTINIAGVNNGIYASNTIPAHSGWIIGGSGNANTISTGGTPLELHDVTASTVSYNTITGSDGTNAIWTSESSNISNLHFENNIVGTTNSRNLRIVPDWGYSDAISTTMSDVNIVGNTFSNWGTESIEVGAGDRATGVVINGNKFNDTDTDLAIKNLGTTSINATNNWWGSAQKSTITPKIVGLVDYTPWYMQEGMTTLSSSDTTGSTAVLTNSISGRTEVRDADNVTITSTFADANGLDTGVTPTISIDYADVGMTDISGVAMTAGGDANTWTYPWNVPLGDTTAAVTVSAQDIVGNPNSAATGITAYTIDNTAPISTLSGTPGNPTNATALDVTVGGLGVVTYKYHLEGGSYGSAIPIATKITNSELAASSHTLYTKGIDAAGNEQTTETTYTWTIDTSAPSVVLSYSVASPVKAGTETITATYSEAVKTGETPEISIDQPGSTDIANVAMTIGADRQHWTYAYTVNTANSGTYIDGTATVSLSTNHDEAGNPAGSPSNSTFVIDTTAPVATLNALTPDPSNHNTPTFTGNVTDSGSVLASIQYRYQRGSDGWSGWNDVTITDGALDGVTENFSFETTTLIDGNYTIEVKGTDQAGNESNSASDTFSIDIVPPAVSGANIAVTGNTGTGGKFKRGDTVQVAWNSTGSGDNNSDIASASVSFAEFGGGTVAATNTAGVWSASYALANDINLTGKKVSVTAVDTATNSRTTADDATFDVDTQNPAAPSIDMSDPVNDANQTAITLSGGGDANGTLNYSIVSSGGVGTVSGTIAIDGTTGLYSKIDVNVSTLLDGTLTATAYVIDTAGNTGPSITDSSVKDTAHPTITDVNSGHADGSFKAGAVIDIDVTFSENVTSGSVTVNLDSGGSCSFPITDSASGTCDYTVGAGQNSADLTTSSISGTIADQHGNAMTVSTPATNLATHKAIIVDTIAPGAPTVTVPAGPITVNEDNYFLQGAAEANALVKIYRDGTTLVASQQLTGGATAYSISVTLNQDATNNFTAKATDTAGNEGAGTAAPTITEDSLAPTVDAGTDKVKNALFAQDATTSDTFGPITYAWSKQTGPGTVTFSAATSEDTNVSALTDGTYVIRLTVTDAAGNSNFDEFTLTWDTTAPTSAATSPSYDSFDGINVNFSTGADLSGVAQVQLWYKLGDGGTWTNTGQTFAAASGMFAFTPSGDGTYYFATKAIDNATNQEADPTGSGDDSTIYDTVDPGAPINFAVTSGAPYNTWTSTTNTAISWTASPDTTSGLDGFNYMWDTNSTASLQGNMTPSDGSTWTGNEATVTNSKTFTSDGEWYFHIRPRDNAGNWGATTNYGPFKIDTTKPSVTHTAVTQADAGADINIDATITDTAGSGISTKKIFYKHHGDTGYTEANMSTSCGSDCYRATIPDEENSDYNVHYYIEVADASSPTNTERKPASDDYTVDIIPAALDHFTFIKPSGNKTAGSNFAIAIEARDRFNNIAESYNGGNNKVNFTTDQTGISVYVDGGVTSTSDSFDTGTWVGNIRFGTGGIAPSDNNIEVTATDVNSANHGHFLINTTGTNFGSLTAGSIQGAQAGGGEGTAPQGAEGTSTPQVLGEESPTGGEQATGAPAPEGAQNPWRQAIPYALGGTLLLSGIWLWIKRRGGGVGGSTPTILGMMFSSLKTAASKIRMFLW